MVNLRNMMILQSCATVVKELSRLLIHKQMTPLFFAGEEDRAFEKVGALHKSQCQQRNRGLSHAWSSKKIP